MVAKISASYSQAGTLDATLGSDGKLTTDLNLFDAINSVKQQTDGKIVVAGFTSVGPWADFSICRYLIDGSLDSTFSGDGIVTTDISGNDDKAYSMELQPDGKILVSGYAYESGNLAICVVRYNIDGSLDSSFNFDGSAIAQVSVSDDYGNAIAVQDDGKIVVAGHSLVGLDFEFAVVRFNNDGSLDNSFGIAGIKTINIGPAGDLAFSLLLQTDGKMIISGYSDNGTNHDASMIRLNSDGSLDVTFNGDGIVVTDFSGDNESIYTSALQPDGKIILAGFTGGGSNTDFILARYNSDGSLDGTFGNSGSTITSVSSSGDMIKSIALQPDGKIVASGYAWGGADLDFALARYNSDGSLDNTFNSTGTVLTDFSNGNDVAYSVIIQQDLKILAGGSTSGGSGDDIALARYISGLNIGIVDFKNPNNSILVYPNPIEHLVTLEYELINKEEVTITLVSIQGEMIETLMGPTIRQPGLYKESIYMPNSVSPGRYFLNVSTPSGKIVVQIIHLGS